jgi:chromosomal replication initiator protein
VGRRLGRIETKVNSHTYHSWFVPIAFARDDGHAIVVRAADAMTIEWLVKHYGAVIDEALKEIGRIGTRVVFRVRNAGVAGPPILVHSNPDPPPMREPERELPAEALESTGLALRYSFDTFIVGASNQFAHAACRAVAEIAVALVQPVVSVRRRRSRQDAPDARDRSVRADRNSRMKADLRSRRSAS